MHSTPLAFIQNFGWTEILVILLIFIIFFGAKRLPELARSMGKSIKEFKKATSSIEDDIRSAMDEEPEKPSPSQPKSIPNKKEEEKTQTTSKQ